MNTVKLTDMITSLYANYVREVNTNRAIPSVEDGLKPVQRRVLYSAYEIARASFKKSAQVVGWAIGHYHPHGDASVYGSLVNLVRVGLLEGQGNFGAELLEVLPPGAMRYTEVRFKDSLRFMFELPAPMKDGELGYKEPAYAVTPLPLSLIYPTVGIGVKEHFISLLPFEPMSLYEAYLKDDPSLLRLRGLELLHLDPSVWTTGIGTARVKYHTQTARYAGRDVILVYSTHPLAQQCFRPTSLLTLPDRTGEQVFVRDESTNVIRLLIGREYNKRSISNEEIASLVEKQVVRTIRFRLTAVDDGDILLLGMRDWIDRTVRLFKASVEAMKTQKIQAIQDRIQQLKRIEHLKKSGLKTIPSDIADLPIKLLDDSHRNKVLQQLEQELKKAQAINPDVMIMTSISSL